MSHSEYSRRVRFVLLLIIAAELLHGLEELWGDLERPMYYLRDVYFPALCKSLSLDPSHGIVLSVAILVLPLLVSLYLLLGERSPRRSVDCSWECS